MSGEPTYLNSTITAGATAASVAVTIPTGVGPSVSSVVVVYKENGNAVTAPSGFVEAAGSPVANGTNFWLHTFVKNRSVQSESGTWTFSWTGSVFTIAIAASATGCENSCLSVITSAVNTGAVNATPSVSLDPVEDNCLILWFGAAFVGGAWTPPSGFTERQDNSSDITLATSVLAAGSTGSVSGSYTGTAGQTSAVMLALRPPQAGAIRGKGHFFLNRSPARRYRAQPLSPDTGAVSPDVGQALGGQTATFSAGTLAPSDTVAITGQSATFTAGTLIEGDTDALTGQTATFAAGSLTPNDTVALTGLTGTFTAGTVSASGDVTTALAGITATFSAGLLSPADAVPLTGLTATFSAGSLSAGEAPSLAGSTATFTAGTLALAVAIPLTGATATFVAGSLSIPGDVTQALTGLTATFSAGILTPSIDQPVTGGGSGRLTLRELETRLFTSTDEFANPEMHSFVHETPVKRIQFEDVHRAERTDQRTQRRYDAEIVAILWMLMG